MVSCKSSAYWLLLALSAVHCAELDDAVPEGKKRCYLGEAVLVRGRVTPIRSPNANANCTSVNITTLPDNNNLTATITNGMNSCDGRPMAYVSLPGDVSKAATEVKMLWMCYGNDIYCVRAGIADPPDTTAAAAPISTFAVSQTCAMEPKSPTGTSRPNTPTGTAVTGDLPVRGSTVAVTEEDSITSTGPATTKGDGIWPNTTSPYGGPAVTRGTTHDGGNAATTALPGNADMTGGSTQDGGAVPTLTSNPAAPAQHTTPPAEDPVPTNESATLGNGSATSPTGMVTSIRSVDHEAPTCTCHAG